MLVQDLCPKCGGQSFVTNGVLSCPLCGDQEVPDGSIDTPPAKGSQKPSVAKAEPEPEVEPLDSISFSLPAELEKEYSDLDPEKFARKCAFALEYLLGFILESDEVPEQKSQNFVGDFFYKLNDKQGIDLARVCFKFAKEPEIMMQLALVFYKSRESEDY